MPSILVVDDEPDLEILVRQKFRRRIRAGELEFLFAQNGAEALERVRERPDVDMVLSDINMPVMDGLTLIGQLREVSPHDQGGRGFSLRGHGKYPHSHEPRRV
jgi:CheY-like chemotaxis protein